MKPEFKQVFEKLTNEQPATAMLLETQGALLAPLFDALGETAAQRLRQLGMLQDDHELARSFRKLHQEIDFYKSLSVFVKECDVVYNQSTHEVVS